MIRKLTVMLLGGAILLLAVTAALAYNESPMLRAKVAAGELPPVEERLPKEPCVVSSGVLLPEEDLDLEIGQYGGIQRDITIWPGNSWAMLIQNNEPLVIGPGLTGEDIRGNVVRDFSVSEDGKVFTFYMREGLKWSDGVPVTTEDVLFAYEDVLLNEKLTPVFPLYLRAASEADGEPMKLEAIDDYTFRIKFAKSYGGFLTQLAIVGWRRYRDVLKPKHYLKKFHPRYTPMEELEPLIKEEALAKGEWWALFQQKNIEHGGAENENAIGFPVLSPWMLVKLTPQVATFERNPYYFKVDTAGNQLPYIDGVRSELVENLEMVTMKILSGEVDHSYEYGTLSKFPFYKENEEKGGYRTILYDMHRSMVIMLPNLTYEDPVWRKVVRDVRFRKALSLAINYEELIENVYLGFASPTVLTPSEYNTEEANQLLDEMGLDKRDKEGWRLGPDGKVFALPIEYAPYFEEMRLTGELVAEYWKAVGLKATTKTLEIGLFLTRLEANELKITMYFPNGHPDIWWWWYEAGSIGFTYASPLWWDWWTTSGKEGEEPPSEVKRFFRLCSQIMIPVSSQERKQVFDEILSLLHENVWFIDTVVRAKYPVMVSKNMANVARKGLGIAGQFAGEIYFFKK